MKKRYQVVFPFTPVADGNLDIDDMVENEKGKRGKKKKKIRWGWEGREGERKKGRMEEGKSKKKIKN